MPPFPSVHWGATRATFVPIGTTLPSEVPVRVALVFALHEARFVVADIAGRGWCIPGGHLELDETPEQAARREALEECGATLDTLHLLGYYLLTEAPDSGPTLVPAYLANVARFDPLPAQTESRGVRLLTLEELPEHYFLWDALIAAVFAYAWEQAQCGLL